MKQYIAFVLVLALQTFALKADERTQITFATDWKAQAEHGGFYQALATGLYEEAGLDVSIRPGGPQTDLPRLIAAGAIDIGMASNNFQPLNLVAAGADVKVVMASFQKDPQVLMVHPHIAADGIDDLKGMPVFLSDSAIATFWPWLKMKFSFEDNQIRKYTYSLVPWLQNKNTVQEGYASSEPFSAKTAGVEPKVFLFADEGYPGYAGMVMVRNDYFSNNYKTVEKFVKASIEGWKSFVWGNSDAGTKLILADNPEMTLELIDYALGTMRSNQMLGTKNQVGCMTDNRWRRFASEMAIVGVLSEGTDPTSAYTLEFLGHCRDE